jgi:hypothetical protein
MKMLMLGLAFAAIALLSAGTSASADSLNTLTSGGDVYTLNQVGPVGPDTYLVDLTVDTTGAVTSTPVLSSFDIQFLGATSVTIDPTASSSNIGSWSFIGHVASTFLYYPSLSTECVTTINEGPNDWCFQGGPLAVGAAGDTYTFGFDITMPSGTPATSYMCAAGPCGLSHIEFFAQSSLLTINRDILVGGGAPPTVPEPGSLSMLGLGLLGVVGLARKRIAA